jgi:hypothetical protein
MSHMYRGRCLSRMRLAHELKLPLGSPRQAVQAAEPDAGAGGEHQEQPQQQGGAAGGGAEPGDHTLAQAGWGRGGDAPECDLEPAAGGQ